ncbi:AprI/Inh family metalloprotease inhibitor [Bartonella bovis]|uniref:Outer membrane lipoprotein Omp19 n=1 Tax=Bartonella bovis m02 TaxID=1094492 RepID=N6UBY0_9HYPH|nr:AprI/Inh family metalloprotease inhibitor [Bartonella bovis]ENN90134.1 outer membrane lipoprotein Omp19 [Bartonella bovis m02]
MIFSRISTFIALSAIIILSGCSTSRFRNNDSSNAREVVYPVQQMSEFVTAADLPESETSTSSIDEREYSRSEIQEASIELPSNTVDLFPASIAGVWNLSINGKVCRIATPQTKFGQGYRAGPLLCPKTFSGVKSWAVKGKKLYFYDDSGAAIATFYSTSGDYFEGRTFDNQPVFLSR